jgi:hypothetical protein
MGSCQRDRFGPTLQSQSQPEANYTALPLLNHREFINKAKVRYQEGKMFSFYNKLRNVGSPLGVYLIPLDQVRLDCSVCPESMYGFNISDDRYYAMGATLYEKLSDFECIPEKCSRIRHIVDRYVQKNDGYQVLYELLEECHPVLDKNPDYRPPSSDQCDGDVQEYAVKFEAYLTAEELNGRRYKEKEQVRNFLQGLGEEFAPAVQYVRTLMDAWSDTRTLNPKTTLRLLPGTVEDYMNDNTTVFSSAAHHSGTGQIRAATASAPMQKIEEETALESIAKLVKQQVEQSDTIIRALKPAVMQDSPVISQPEAATKAIIAKSFFPNSRKLVDVFCEGCGLYGHEASKCDFTAKLVKVLDYIATLDSTAKKNLLQYFQSEQTKRREQRQTSLAGKARVLRDAGDAEALYNLLTSGDCEDQVLPSDE